ncbi:hypothetical protein CY34DRAFT_804243 [Suillus luteus UH-Slu-Lm8-n1]|uniref:Uncharacterized protein n=1 Tax=Suillus luteus UH-Slu-Lm8-n1 TaxID=930992 RepID=A0A0D0BIQ9_9AGAM|nr:hypothetical protein CY34DRAFT_804243 [Suillus luteus UH-Slu-Lm8-n1]
MTPCEILSRPRTWMNPEMKYLTSTGELQCHRNMVIGEFWTSTLLSCRCCVDATHIARYLSVSSSANNNFAEFYDAVGQIESGNYYCPGYWVTMILFPSQLCDKIAC